MGWKAILQKAGQHKGPSDSANAVFAQSSIEPPRFSHSKLVFFFFFLFSEAEAGLGESLPVLLAVLVLVHGSLGGLHVHGRPHYGELAAGRRAIRSAARFHGVAFVF